MMTAVTPRLVLGSSSPRRLDLLKQINMTPDIVQGPDIDESPRKGETPKAYCRRIALEKNAALADKFPNDFIITADTTLGVGRRIVGKAADAAEAEKILRLISGRSHDVITAIVIRNPQGRMSVKVQTSRVTVKRLTDQDIAEMIASDTWQGCAGAYTMQHLFGKNVVTISGSYSGILGLPLYETAAMLKGLGYGTSS